MPPNASPFEVADLAYTTQYFYSEVMTEFSIDFHAMGVSDNLALGGGCGLNSSYNGQIVGQTPFKQLHLFLRPGGRRERAGVALLAYYQDHPERKPNAEIQSPYLGSSLSKEPISQPREVWSSLPRFSIFLRRFTNRRRACWQTESSSVGSKVAQNLAPVL